MGAITCYLATINR